MQISISFANFVRIRRLAFRHEFRQRARDIGEAEAVGRPDGWRWCHHFILLLGIGPIQRQQKQETATSKGRGMDEQEHVQRRRKGQAKTSTSAGRTKEELGCESGCLSQPNGRDH